MIKERERRVMRGGGVFPSLMNVLPSGSFSPLFSPLFFFLINWERRRFYSLSTCLEIKWLRCWRVKSKCGDRLRDVHMDRAFLVDACIHVALFFLLQVTGNLFTLCPVDTPICISRENVSFHFFSLPSFFIFPLFQFLFSFPFYFFSNSDWNS